MKLKRRKKKVLVENFDSQTKQRYLERLTINFDATRTRWEELDGRKYLVVPMVMIKEGVWPGSNGPLYYPKQELSKTPAVWNHKPIVVYHPNTQGKSHTACDPHVLRTQGVGIVLNTEYEKATGRLKAEAWLEPGKLKKVDIRVWNALKNKQKIEVSTGLFTDNEEKVGVWNDKAYSAIARNYRPDHLAILPDQKGACSVSDGAGLLMNKKQHKVTTADILASFITNEVLLALNYDPGEARDEHGKWTAGADGLKAAKQTLTAISRRKDSAGDMQIEQAYSAARGVLKHPMATERDKQKAIQHYAKISTGSSKQIEGIKESLLKPDKKSNFLGVGKIAGAAVSAATLPHRIAYKGVKGLVQSPIELGKKLKKHGKKIAKIVGAAAVAGTAGYLAYKGSKGFTKNSQLISNAYVQMFGRQIGDPLICNYFAKQELPSLQKMVVNAVIEIIENYDPNQPRGPKGTPYGGQFVSESVSRQLGGLAPAGFTGPSSEYKAGSDLAFPDAEEQESIGRKYGPATFGNRVHHAVKHAVGAYLHASNVHPAVATVFHTYVKALAHKYGNKALKTYYQQSGKKPGQPFLQIKFGKKGEEEEGADDEGQQFKDKLLARYIKRHPELAERAWKKFSKEHDATPTTENKRNLTDYVTNLLKENAMAKKPADDDYDDEEDDMDEEDDTDDEEDTKKKSKSKTKKDCAMNKAEMIKHLVTNGGYDDEDDQEFLEAMPDEKLAKLANSVPVPDDKLVGNKKKADKKAPVLNKKKPVQNEEEDESKELTAEEYIAMAPPAIREMLTTNLAMIEEQKAELVANILKNPNNEFSEEFLENSSVEVLQGISKIAGAVKTAPVQNRMRNYFGNSGTGKPDPEAKKVTPLAIPTMNFKKEEPDKELAGSNGKKK